MQGELEVKLRYFKVKKKDRLEKNASHTEVPFTLYETISVPI